MSEKQDIKAKIEGLEAQMVDPHFWDDKVRAQSIIKEIQDLKDELEGIGKYDRGGAVMTIFSGAGGDDAEDFSRILLEMYQKYASNKGWVVSVLHSNANDHGGYRNVTIEIAGNNVYGTLKYESGVHRLVRISPFNANQKRHTSFSMVEVIPLFDTQNANDLQIPPDELSVEFSKSSGPGGQNVNKRETAVRIVHLPTKISAHVDSERSQEQNRERAMALVMAKLAKALEEAEKSKVADLSVSKTTEIEWGNQIRSYVFHPYQMVKDHRTNTEIRDIDRVVKNGDIDPFIDAAREL